MLGSLVDAGLDDDEDGSDVDAVLDDADLDDAVFFFFFFFLLASVVSVDSGGRFRFPGGVLG